MVIAIAPTRARTDASGWSANICSARGNFWCRWPLPSVSLDTPGFNPIDMWRGATWVNANWMVIEGLLRQGFHAEAMRLGAKRRSSWSARATTVLEKRGRFASIFSSGITRTRGEPLGNAQYFLVSPGRGFDSEIFLKG